MLTWLYGILGFKADPSAGLIIILPGVLWGGGPSGVFTPSKIISSGINVLDFICLMSLFKVSSPTVTITIESLKFFR